MDVKHGLVEDYSSDGHLFTQGNYVDGKRDGVHKNYFENSKQIHKIHIFKKGKLVGQNITYFKNGGVEKKQVIRMIGNMVRVHGTLLIARLLKEACSFQTEWLVALVFCITKTVM